LSYIFDKRYPIAHNLGVVDKKYIGRGRSSESEGIEIRVEKAEAATASDLVFKALE